MRIAFISPSLYTLLPWWKNDPQIIKLAVPSISGYLYSSGYKNIRQYDFELEIFNLERKIPGKLNLRLFYDDKSVDRFLISDDAEVRSQTELICDTLNIDDADIFGLSCSSGIQQYSEMHAVSNLNLCLTKILKERFPLCKTVIGGSQISPSTKQKDEYADMLKRCPTLDFAVEGPGEEPMLHIIEHISGKASFDENKQRIEQTGNGIFLHMVLSIRKKNAAMAAKQKKKQGFLNNNKAPEEKPEDAHQHEHLAKPAVFITPYFDPVIINKRKITDLQLMRRYHFSRSMTHEMMSFNRKNIIILPMIFVEGCNWHCAFCAHSRSTMTSQDIDDLIRSIAWLRKTYNTRYFHFLNTNINVLYEYADSFCDALIDAKLDILWSDSANFRMLDGSLLEKMRRSGCIRLVLGIECPSEKMLKYIHKGVTIEHASRILKKLHEQGIWNHLQFITGMPHETDEDISKYCEFIEKTNEYVNAYSISPFYIDFQSRMGTFPDKYGLELLHDPADFLEKGAFNEINGLKWKEKKKQIEKSTQKIRNVINKVKNNQNYSNGTLHLEPVFWLYDCFGHDKKAEIVRIYEERVMKKSSRSSKALVDKPEPETSDPDIKQLGIFLQNEQTDFAGFKISKVVLDQHNKVYVTLGNENNLIKLIIARSEAMPHYFIKTGIFSISYLNETPLDNRTKEKAVREFADYLNKNLDE
jgi:radical SAM superfamily enzyme YgiQ (UPF0313 family)